MSLELAQSVHDAASARDPDLAGAPSPVFAESPRLPAPGGRPPRARGPPSQQSMQRDGVMLQVQVIHASNANETSLSSAQNGCRSVNKTPALDMPLAANCTVDDIPLLGVCPMVCHTGAWDFKQAQEQAECITQHDILPGQAARASAGDQAGLRASMARLRLPPRMLASISEDLATGMPHTSATHLVGICGRKEKRPSWPGQ